MQHEIDTIPSGRGMQMNNIVSLNGGEEEPVQEAAKFFFRMGNANLLIVGGDAFALEQLNEILASGPPASIKLVAKEFIQGILDVASLRNNIILLQKEYDKSDLENADFVVIATQNPDLVQTVEDDTMSQGLSGIPAVERWPGRRAVRIRDNGGSGIEKSGKVVPYKKIATYAVTIFGLMLLGHFVFSYLPLNALKDPAFELYQSLDQSFLIMLAAGFIAQLVDGALGMGYGVASTTVLLSAGVSPAAISRSIHTAEMFASGASGYSHYKFGNVNKKLFKTLLLPGVVGAICGAILLVYLGENFSDWVRPVLACYTLFLGIKILLNAFKKTVQKKRFRRYRALAGAGGFLDSFGGGGWGPLVTTTLITKGRTPKYVIGSVSLTVFFVTLASAFTFFILLGVSHWQTILGLIVGGLVAAPIAARLAGRLPRKTSFILLGILVIVWSIRILVKLF